MPSGAPRCLTCGYNLTGLPAAGRCPECGADYDLARPAAEAPYRPSLPTIVSLVGIGAGILFTIVLMALEGGDIKASLPMTLWLAFLVLWCGLIVFVGVLSLAEMRTTTRPRRVMVRWCVLSLILFVAGALHSRMYVGVLQDIAAVHGYNRGQRALEQLPRDARE